MFIEILKVIFIGIVEGITEWLPISSTGHMLLVDQFAKLQADQDFKDMFFVVIQLGAIIAVMYMYWSKLWPFRIARDNKIPTVIDSKGRTLDACKDAECCKFSPQRDGKIVACREIVNLIDEVIDAV